LVESSSQVRPRACFAVGPGLLVRVATSPFCGAPWTCSKPGTLPLRQSLAEGAWPPMRPPVVSRSQSLARGPAMPE